MPKSRLFSTLPDPGPRPPEESPYLSDHLAGRIMDRLRPRNPDLVAWERRVASIVDGAQGADAYPLLQAAGYWPGTLLPEEVTQVKAEFKGAEVTLRFIFDPLVNFSRLHGGRLPWESRYSRGVIELERDRRRSR